MTIGGRDARRSSAVLLLLGCAVPLALAGCGPSLIEADCGAGGGCVAVVPVPTDSRAKHVDGDLTPLEGTLEATVRRGQVCLLLDRGARAALNLVLPEGTRATPLGDLPPSGPADVRLLGDNGFGGVRTGERIAVTPDARQATARVGGCPAGPTVFSGSVTRLPAPTVEQAAAHDRIGSTAHRRSAGVVAAVGPQRARTRSFGFAFTEVRP